MIQFFTIAGRRYAQFGLLAEQPGLLHGFCTRPMDVSPARTANETSRARMAADLGLSIDRLCYCLQVHETSMAVVNDGMVGGLPRCDGAMTATPGVALMTFSADCPLVLAYDPVRPALGMVHASWRCTVASAAARLVARMVAELGCRAGDLLAGIGPGAGPCCYEVGDDVFAAAAALPDRDALFQRCNGRRHFDLWAANRAQLLAAGVRPENIATAGLCTLCRNDVFYSFRREGPGCGHFGLMAGLRAGERKNSTAAV